MNGFRHLLVRLCYPLRHVARVCASTLKIKIERVLGELFSNKTAGKFGTSLPVGLIIFDPVTYMPGDE
jgi:hypothetical protein